MAVALFTGTNSITGEVNFSTTPTGTKVHAVFTELPKGKHGFHIHKAGDLRGEGCKGACDHFHMGPQTQHGGPPNPIGKNQQPRHTGDLGNLTGPKDEVTYLLKGVTLEDLWGRSVIVHEDEDDLGRGPFEDSHTTGHSGKRIGCALIGRVQTPACNGTTAPAKTRKVRRNNRRNSIP
jgi:Cu-Zn family superoxide dismutase